MHLPSRDINIQLGSSLDEKTFGIGDTALVISMLRDKMYSNPILSAVREYASNAKDAHTEADKRDVAIEIHIPHAFDPHLKVKDFGLGISPDRMENVFIQYARSTKRNDNTQIGGWGLGAKSGFAVSNSFTIITTSQENGNNTKRIYIAYIDESQSGKIRLVKEEPTQEPPGTEIVIPVKKEDFQKFAEAVVECTTYWSVRPLLTGDSKRAVYPKERKSIKGTGWELFYSDENYRSDRSTKAVIDGIAYPVDPFSLGLSYEDRYTFENSIAFHFNIGELTLVPSREHLQYDENTKFKLLAAAEVLKKEFGEHCRSQIENAPSYLEAYQIYKGISDRHHSLLPKDYSPTWKGTRVYTDGWIPLDVKEVGVPFVVSGFIRSYIETMDYRPGHNQEKFITGKNSNSIALLPNYIFVINDTGKVRIPRNKIKVLLEDESVAGIQVVSFVSGTLAENLDRIKNRTTKPLDLTLLNPVYLSKVEVSEEVKEKSKKERKAKVLEIYKMGVGCASDWEATPVSKDDLKNFAQKTVVKLTKRNKVITIGSYRLSDTSGPTGDITIRYADLEFLQKELGITIFGVKEADYKYLKNHTELHTLLTAKVDDILKSGFDINYNPKITDVSFNNIFSDYYYGDIKEKLLKNITELSVDSVMVKYIQESLNVEAEHSSNLNKLRILRIAGSISPDTASDGSKLSELYDLVLTTYPLLHCIDLYKFNRSNSKNTNALISYIKLIDTQQKENENATLDTR